jgi:hypothetical protein
MPVEIIGEAGTPSAAREWISAEGELAIKHLKKVCGEPPPEMELSNLPLAKQGGHLWMPPCQVDLISSQ